MRTREETPPVRPTRSGKRKAGSASDSADASDDFLDHCHYCTVDPVRLVYWISSDVPSWLALLFFRMMRLNFVMLLFNGLLPRCVFFGALIAGQFLLYDDLKRVFKVGPDDILFVLDVFSDRLSFYDDY